MHKRLLTGFAVLVVASLAPAQASAQYKNSAFGLDLGGWLISKPSVTENNQIVSVDKRPLRLSNGGRLGGETNFKMDADHFWMTFRVNVAFLQFLKGNSDLSASIDDQFDAAARDRVGTLFGIEGSLGVRYVFLTDRFRPYLQTALSYMRLMSFSSQLESSCDLALACTGSDNESEFLPHPNVGGIHLQPGVEMVVDRDVAVHLFVDLQRWIVFNAPDNYAVVIGLGMLFFT